MIRFELSKGYHRVLNADTDGEQFLFDNSDDHHHTDDDNHSYNDALITMIEMVKILLTIS